MAKGMMQIIPDTRAKFTNARLLLHPNIPKPLHQVNPRSIMGRAEWDRVRRQVYPINNFCCFACGIHKSNAYFHHWLECHEDYIIDYKKGRVVISDLAALCHACHNFIHSGRLMMMALNGEMPVEKFWGVMYRGFLVLREAKEPPNPFALHSVEQIMLRDKFQEFIPGWARSHAFQVQLNKYPLPDDETVPWEAWRLVYLGKEYKPKFPTYESWLDNYQPGWRDRARARAIDRLLDDVLDDRLGGSWGWDGDVDD